MNFSIYFKIVRSHALMISILPVLCCYSYVAYNYQNLNNKAFIFVGIAAVLFHLSTNSISEYRDFIKGTDDPDVEDPKYKLARCCQAISNPKNILYIGVTAFTLASISGIIAVIFSSIEILFAGLFGAFISLFYSEWPFGYKYKALGELAVFIAYGPLLVFSCVFSLASHFNFNDLLFSMPFGLLATSILTANNIRDYDYDMRRIKTLATVLGLRLTYSFLFFIVNLAFLTIPILIYNNALPKSSFFVFLSYPLLFLSIKRISTPKFIDVFGMLNVFFCLILCFVFLASILYQ